MYSVSTVRFGSSCIIFQRGKLQTKAKTNQNLYDFLMQNNISSFREQMFNQCIMQS